MNRELGNFAPTALFEGFRGRRPEPEPDWTPSTPPDRAHTTPTSADKWAALSPTALLRALGELPVRSPYAVRPLSTRIRFTPGRIEFPRVQDGGALLSRALVAMVFAEHQDQRPAPPSGRLRFWTPGSVQDEVPGWVVVEDAEADAARGPAEEIATRLVLSDVLTVAVPPALQAWLSLWWEEREVALDPSLGPQRQALRDAWARGAELLLIQGDDHNLGRGLARWLHARLAPTLPLRPLLAQGIPELEPGGLWLWEQPQDEEPERARRLTRTLDRALVHQL